MKRQNVRTLALIVCTFTYLLIGAAIFDELESKHESNSSAAVKAKEEDWKRRLNLTNDQFEQLYRSVITMKPYKSGKQWEFAGSFYFATTVITTIGYGHSTPKTDEGKIFCMIYALGGIPLCIVMFQSIGERMNIILTATLRAVKRLFRASNDTVSQTHLILVSVSVGVIVLTTGAAAFASYEDWDYLDALYYCFITLTTIGFGDFVALQRNDSLSKKPDYVAFSLIFILFGLTVVSSAMNLLVLRFLTMNTEDERRDEIEAAIQAHDRGCLQGDVIVSNGRPSSAFLYPLSGNTSKRLSVLQLVEYHPPPSYLDKIEPPTYSTNVQNPFSTNRSSFDDQEPESSIPISWCSCCLRCCSDDFIPLSTSSHQERHRRPLYSRDNNVRPFPFNNSRFSHSPALRYWSGKHRRHFTVIRSPGAVHHLAEPIPIPPREQQIMPFNSRRSRGSIEIGLSSQPEDSSSKILMVERGGYHKMTQLQTGITEESIGECTPSPLCDAVLLPTSPPTDTKKRASL